MPFQFGKQTTLPFNNSVSHALSSFDLIHYCKTPTLLNVIIVVIELN